MDLSIIVVSYNTRELTLECLRSIVRETSELEYEVLVVDNDSSDGSAEAIAAEFSDLRFFALDTNLGFGAANNLAAEHARGDKLLLLNPDTVVLRSAISKLYEFSLAHPDASIWGGRTVFGDGRLNAGSCWGAPTAWSALCLSLGLASRFDRSEWLNPEGLGGWDRDSVRSVAIVSGCFLMITRAMWSRLQGFHADFFMYGEDADLCLRAHTHGARPLINPASEIVHYGGASEKVQSAKMVRLFAAKAQLFRKFMRPSSAWLALRTLDLWAFHRLSCFFVLNLFSNTHAGKLDTWKSVWHQRGVWRAAWVETVPYEHTSVEDCSNAKPCS